MPSENVKKEEKAQIKDMVCNSDVGTDCFG
jgi:hypothetical protein